MQLEELLEITKQSDKLLSQSGLSNVCGQDWRRQNEFLERSSNNPIAFFNLISNLDVPYIKK